MNPLPPWANGPFELLVHAEGHLRAGEDFDRRIALISFDNALEVAVTSYLTLNPFLRGNRTYKNDDVERWLRSYHSKLEFLAEEIRARGSSWAVERGHIVWAHDQRNEQYHGGNKGTPEKSCLAVIRKGALWVFGFLFEVADAEQRLEEAIAATAPPAPPQRDRTYDAAIDEMYSPVFVGDQEYEASDVLFSVDYWAYRDIGARLCQNSPTLAAEGSKK